MARKRDQYDTLDPRAHMGLVYKWAAWAAKRYGGERDEYIGPAYLGLLDGLRTFNPAKCGRTSTHLVNTIRWKLDSHNKRDTRGGRRSSNDWKYVGRLEELSPTPDNSWEKWLRTVEAEQPRPRSPHLAEAVRAAAKRFANGPEVADLLSRGLKEASIARCLNMTRANVNRIVVCIRQALGVDPNVTGRGMKRKEAA